MEALSVPRMILIGSSGRNQGKTTLAKALIRRFCGRVPIAALKITTVTQKHRCPRGGDGCGVCAGFDGGWLLEEETDKTAQKDTAQLLSAGAGRVFWLRAEPAHILTGFTRFLEQIEPDRLIICESNSLREYARPACFIMLTGGGRGKPSAARVARLADITVDGEADLNAVASRVNTEQTARGLSVSLSVP
ncbi:MAG: hypothetical protein LBT12_06900 [Oscillospiraceae bacterium]|jgi:hypothetical protein|nr:hypothetical protein [Oscillospiraceae bacterium]